jgi:hypothetical protein
MKTLTKIFVAVILLAVIAGVSFIKSSISAQRETEKIDKLKEEYFKTQDSLLAAQLSDSVARYIDSIRLLDEFYISQIDSLNKYYNDRELLVIDSVKKLKSQPTQKTTSKKKKKSKTTSKNQKIKKEYSSLIAKLPKDLTSYEKRVAYNEIKIELAQKYKLSPEKLNKILK